ncbi:protein SMALL AUXIN UP-REGULATED RNA 16-like [Apium graveolens]|uniref:protein SMALL AUXIN UP-REGULATED RNA 16-like n=1 Tax=Apium graveolens TaxID=4045 RepID=UPI003D7BA5F3
MAIKKSDNIFLQPTFIKQLLKKCSSLGKKQKPNSNEPGLPTDVPKGHFAVYVGKERTRHVVPISFLNYPEFLRLLQRAEEEFGFNYDMGLTIPCEGTVFESLTSVIRIL